jgi:hypothetical protein
VRLTLRTLLSYLDDTLEPAQAKAIGAKVAESEQARELMERIKQVTRRRRLTTPTTSGPGGIDPNTIAEYLDNDVTPEQAAEVEQICLASDVHLAEVAACHQILTLVLGEPALVPPTAKQRMYVLVKGPESIPFRKPAKPATKDDQDLSSEIEPDQDDTLRLGVPRVNGDNRNLWLLIGGGTLAACLLIFAVWGLVKPGPKDEQQIAQNDKDKDKDKAGDKDKDKDGDKDKGKKKTQDEKDKDKDKTNTKKIDETPPNPKNLPITLEDPKVNLPPKVEYQAANPAQVPVGVYLQPGAKEPSAVLLQAKPGSGGWGRVVAEKKKNVVSGRPLVSLPGSKSVVILESGVEVTLWGNLPESTLDYSVLESRAVIHSNVPQLDADLTLDRGRILLRNKRMDGKDALIRLRFNDPTQGQEDFFDIILNGSEAAIVVDRACEMDRDEPFYESEKDANRKGPTAIMKIFAYELSANIHAGGLEYSVSQMQQQMLQWTSRTGKLVIPAGVPAPPWIKGNPELKDEGSILARKKAVEACERLAKILDTKPIDVALAEVNQTVQANAQKEMIGGKLPSLDTFTQWRHAIRCEAAVDSISDVYDEFARTDTPIFIRGLCMQTLQQWIAWNRDQDYELLKAVKKYHNNKTTVSIKIMELFHGVSTDDARKPTTYQHLIENLNNDVLPIRTLSHWHLIKLAPAGGEIPYDPAASAERRQMAIRQWIALIPPGQLPGATPPPKKKKV